MITRRTFFKKSIAFTAASTVFPRFSIGQAGPSANSKLNIAMIGSGGIADMALKELREENVIAMCDIDSTRFPKRAADQNIPTFADFRVMLDKMGKEIDGVCVNTPDHTHFTATIDAMQRGIHVCTQKPLTHNIWQARTLKKAKDKYKVVTNMANQGHTYKGIRQMKEWYEADVFGQISEVRMGFKGPEWGSKYFRKPESMPLTAEDLPEHIDWDLWLGPAAEVPYNSHLHPLTWRGFSDYGTGQFGDWFCHIGDGPVWILDLYEPTVIECEERAPNAEGLIPDYSTVRFDFPQRGDKAPCQMYWYDGWANGGATIPKPDDWDKGRPEPKKEEEASDELSEKKKKRRQPKDRYADGSFWWGEKQNGYLDRRSNNPRLASFEAMKDFKKGADIPQTYERVKQRGPFGEWAAAIKGDIKECGSNFDYAAPMTEVALIGVIAQRFGGRIEWDAKKGEITNRPELNAFVKEPVRAGWEYGEDLWKA